jgi:hypothetical protein
MPCHSDAGVQDEPEMVVCRSEKTCKIDLLVACGMERGDGEKTGGRCA